jgi:hypothetical protein
MFVLVGEELRCSGDGQKLRSENLRFLSKKSAEVRLYYPLETYNRLRSFCQVSVLSKTAQVTATSEEAGLLLTLCSGLFGCFTPLF